jgi:hypothetical protein
MECGECKILGEWSTCEYCGEDGMSKTLEHRSAALESLLLEVVNDYLEICVDENGRFYDHPLADRINEVVGI